MIHFLHAEFIPTLGRFHEPGWLGLARFNSHDGTICRDLGMSFKHNKNQRSEHENRARPATADIRYTGNRARGLGDPGAASRAEDRGSYFSYFSI